MSGIPEAYLYPSPFRSHLLDNTDSAKPDTYDIFFSSVGVAQLHEADVGVPVADHDDQFPLLSVWKILFLFFQEKV